MERIGYHTTAAKACAPRRAHTMSIRSSPRCPKERLCSSGRRVCRPLRLLSLSPPSSFISVRKTLSRGPHHGPREATARRHLYPVSGSEENQPAPSRGDAIVLRRFRMTFLFSFSLFLFLSPSASTTFRNTRLDSGGASVPRMDVL